MIFIYIFLVLIMAFTASFCEATSISYLALFTPIIFFGKREYLLSLILFASILFYRVPPGIPIMPLLIILYIASIIVNDRIVRFKWDVDIRACVLFIAACGYLVLSCYTSLSASYDSLFKMITFVALVYFAVYDNSCDTNLLQKLLLIASLVGIVCISAKLVISPDMSMEGRASISEFHNPNVVARGLATMVLVIFVGRRFWVKAIPNIILDGTILLGLIAIFFTGSRMGILSTIITIATLLYMGSKNKSTRTINFVLIGALLIFISAVFISITNVDLGRFATGFTSNIIEEDARVTSSQVLWSSAISQHPFTGIGLGSDNSKLILVNVPDADNFIIDAITQVGLIGFTAMLVLFIKSIRSLNRLKKYKGVQLSVIALPMAFLISQIPFCFSETVFDELMMWYSIALAQIYINSLSYGAISNYSCSKL